MDAPISQSVKIRPVYKRYLARKHHMQPGPPTELEKRDAIAVMRECYPPVFEIEEILLAEAELILHESDVDGRITTD